MTTHNWQFTGHQQLLHYSGENRREFKCLTCNIIEFGPPGYPGGCPDVSNCSISNTHISEHEKQLIKERIEQKIRDTMQKKNNFINQQKLKRQTDIQSDTKATDDENTCIHCLENIPTWAFIPCGHQILCSKCKWDYSDKKLDSQCPMCKTSTIIPTIIKIFK